MTGPDIPKGCTNCADVRGLCGSCAYERAPSHESVGNCPICRGPVRQSERDEDGLCEGCQGGTKGAAACERCSSSGAAPDRCGLCGHALTVRADAGIPDCPTCGEPSLQCERDDAGRCVSCQVIPELPMACHECTERDSDGSCPKCRATQEGRAQPDQDPPRMVSVYVAGPFNAKTGYQIERNVRAAEALALDVASLGALAECPHTQSRHLAGTLTERYWIAATREQMRRCDTVILVPGWEHSPGTLGEITEAERLGMPVHHSLMDLAHWLDTKPEPARIRRGGETAAEQAERLGWDVEGHESKEAL